MSRLQGIPRGHHRHPRHQSVAAAASEPASSLRLSRFEQNAANLHKKVNKLARASGKVKASSRLRHKVLKTNALVKRMNRSLVRLNEAVPAATVVDDAFVAEVLARNASAAHLDKHAIRLSRRTLKSARSGQTVVCPAGTFTGDVRVPSGVTVIGQGMDRPASSARSAGARTPASATSPWTGRPLARARELRHRQHPVRARALLRRRLPAAASSAGTTAPSPGSPSAAASSRCDFGTWSANGGAGLLWFAVDTGQGTVIRDVNILDCHFGVSNGAPPARRPTASSSGRATRRATGYWGDVLIEGNTFEVTAEFTLDFDGLETRSYHNDVVIRDNLIKGCGLPHEGGNAAWPYSICVEPSRAGTVIEDNVIGKGRGQRRQADQGRERHRGAQQHLRLPHATTASRSTTRTSSAPSPSSPTAAATR